MLLIAPHIYSHLISVCLLVDIHKCGLINTAVVFPLLSLPFIYLRMVLHTCGTANFSHSSTIYNRLLVQALSRPLFSSLPAVRSLSLLISSRIVCL